MANFPIIDKRQPGMHTATLEIGVAGLGGRTFEIDQKHELEAVKALIADGAERILSIHWVHHHNRPNCLPPVVANCCAMFVFELQAGEIVSRQLDIY